MLLSDYDQSGSDQRTLSVQYRRDQSEAEKFVTQAGRQAGDPPTQGPTLTAYIAR